MNVKYINPKKFCKIPQIDIVNIYLGPKNILSYCSCPSPTKSLEYKPFDEEYLNDSRYISEKDKVVYNKLYNSMKENTNFECYNYQPQEIIENNFLSEEYVEESMDDISDEDDEYVDDGEFEFVRK